MNLCIPIVNRTNYSKLKLVLQNLSPDIQKSIIISSSTLLSRYGNPYKDIEADGLEITDMIDCLLVNDTQEAMVKTMALSMIEHSAVFARKKPDALLVVGDRFDMIPPVLAAHVMNIPILHIQGGEETGSIDDTIRGFISVCASAHYVSTEISAQRVRDITKSENIYIVGCPAVEALASIDIGESFDAKAMKKQYKNEIPIAKYEPYLLVVVHPNTLNEADVDMIVLLSAILSIEMKCIVMYPNADAHNAAIVSSISSLKGDLIIPIKHAPLEDFARMMGHASCMVGNSSSGIREAASFGVPVVNIGDRQQGRERNENTMDVDCNGDSIIFAVEQQLKKGRYPKDNLYCIPGVSIEIARLVKEFLHGICHS